MLDKFMRDIRLVMQRPVLAWLVSAILFVMIVGAFTDFLMEVFGTWETALLAWDATVITIFVVRPFEAMMQLMRSWGQTEVTVEEVGWPVPRHRGLIVLSSIGGGIGSAENAIRYHWRESPGAEDPEPVLEHCWIITGGPASEQSASALVDQLVQDGFPLAMFHPCALTGEESDNPQAVHELVDRIYTEAAQTYGLAEEEVIADYTGGTKSMTSGLVLACASPRRPLQFMKPRHYDADGRADQAAGSDPEAIDIRFELVPSRRSQ